MLGYAFYGCDALAEVTLPDNMTMIGPKAFPETTTIYATAGSKTAETLTNAGYTFVEIPVGLPAPANLTVTPVSNYANITWDAVEGAAGYFVYLADVTDLAEGEEVEYFRFNIVSSGEGKTSYYARGTKGDLTIGNTYRFKVAAYSYDDEANIVVSENEAVCEPFTFEQYGEYDEATGLYYGIENENQIRILGYDGEEANLVIPKQIAGCDVWYIGLYAFIGNTTIETVVLPDGLISLDSGAFRNCTNLKSVVIPDSVWFIHSDAFRITGITEITLPDDVRTVGSFAFPDDATIYAKANTTTAETLTAAGYTFTPIATDITVEEIDGVKTITAVDKTLTEIIIPDDVEAIADGAFAEAAITSIVVPDTVTEMGDGVFAGCTALTTAELPSGMTTIPACTFDGCSSLTEVTVDNATEIIGEGAFRDCKKLETLNCKPVIAE